MTQIEIANLALSNLGTGVAIQDIDEGSQESKVIKQFWDVALRYFLRIYSFPHTKKYYTLELVEENPNDEWLFSYRYPSDALLIKKILSGFRQDTHETRVPYAESHDDQGKLILTDMAEAQVLYIPRDVNLAFFSEEWAIAFSYLVSYFIAPRLTGGNAFTGITKQMFQLFQLHAGMAQSTAANEVQADIEPESEFIRGRD